MCGKLLILIINCWYFEMKKSHNWETFVNPRNGKVRIKACTQCGSINIPLVADLECNMSSSKPGRLADWTPLKDVA